MVANRATQRPYAKIKSQMRLSRHHNGTALEVHRRVVLDRAISVLVISDFDHFATSGWSLAENCPDQFGGFFLAHFHRFFISRVLHCAGYKSTLCMGWAQ